MIAVDPVTGDQTIVSQGGHFRDPNGLFAESSGQLLVADASGKLIRVDPATGAQTLIASGLNYPGDVAVTIDSAMMVTSRSGGQVIRIDPSTGSQSVLTSGFVNPNGIAVDAQGDLLVADEGLADAWFPKTFSSSSGRSK